MVYLRGVSFFFVLKKWDLFQALQSTNKQRLQSYSLYSLSPLQTKKKLANQAKGKERERKNLQGQLNKHRKKNQKNLQAQQKKKYM